MKYDEGKAIYLQIMDHISGNIASGILKPGQRVLPVREYAVEYGVNPNTMQRALYELERDGVLFSERNTGRYVTKDLEKIAAMKAAQAEEAVHEFCAKMLALGYSPEEAEGFFREKMKSELKSMGEVTA